MCMFDYLFNIIYPTLDFKLCEDGYFLLVVFPSSYYRTFYMFGACRWMDVGWMHAGMVHLG